MYIYMCIYICIYIHMTYVYADTKQQTVLGIVGAQGTE